MLSLMRLAFFLCLSLYAQPKPCASPAHRAADFLLGDWEVRDGKDRLMGWSRFEAHAAGCAIVEHWRGVRGGEGTGLFFYDPAAKLWKREYVGPGFIERNAKATIEGQALAFTATADKAQMKYRYDKDAQGPFLIDQESTDGGQTWSPPERRSMRPLSAPKNFEPKNEIAPQCSAPEFRKHDARMNPPEIKAYSKGCVLLEIRAPGSAQSSVTMSYYDPEEKRWIERRVSPSANQRLNGPVP